MKQIIYEHLKKCPPALELFKKLEQYGNLYLIGGVLREFKDHGCIQELRDIDIVVDTLEKENCKVMLNEYEPQINTFGGYKISDVYKRQGLLSLPSAIEWLGEKPYWLNLIYL